MAVMNMDTLRFQLYQVLQIEDLFKYERYKEYDRETIDIYLDSVKDYADQEVLASFREMDDKPAYFDKGTIVVHEKVGSFMRKAGELGLISATYDYDDGGAQLPATISQLLYFIVETANNNLPGYAGLTLGASRLIHSFGSDDLKKAYLPNMLSGDWAGTMCLTEPQAGSSLSDITTQAKDMGDGSYAIKGQKIFISGGDHEYCDNFVHLVLARIQGAPLGTKGISLFVVPKMRLAGQELTHNDVAVAGDFQKVGQRGYCTTHLTFGEKDDCKGWLVGQPHRGLSYMFQMMNESRIAVGRGGVAIACAAYHASLQYANERPQGRKVGSSGAKDPTSAQTPIINHPDVRRMLILQKAVYEGGLCLVSYCSQLTDLVEVSSAEDAAEYHLLLELLTPVCKTYPAEMGITAVNNGVQVLGGYGFCSDFVLQQYMRDIRIMSIYEGTTGIQSMDLLGRKLTAQNGKALLLLQKEIDITIEAANTFDELKPYAVKLANQIKNVQKVLGHLMAHVQAGDFERFLADATPFMDFFGNLVIGWLWLKMAETAKRALVIGDTQFTTDFYESKIETMRFFYKYELPKMNYLAEVLMNEEVVTIKKDKELIK